MTKLRHIHITKRLVLASFLVCALVVAPIGVNALSDDTSEETPLTTMSEEVSTDESTSNDPEQTQEETPTEPTQEETPPADDGVETPAEADETPTEEQAAETDLQAAITIAALEHPGVEVVAAKLKYLAGEKVYKVAFADGWRIYVRASDGEVIRIKDKQNNGHDCQNRARKSWKQRTGSWNPWSTEYRDYSRGWLKDKKWRATNATEQTDDQSVQAAQTTGEYRDKKQKREGRDRNNDRHQRRNR